MVKFFLEDEVSSVIEFDSLW